MGDQYFIKDKDGIVSVSYQNIDKVVQILSSYDDIFKSKLNRFVFDRILFYKTFPASATLKKVTDESGITYYLGGGPTKKEKKLYDLSDVPLATYKYVITKMKASGVLIGSKIVSVDLSRLERVAKILNKEEYSDIISHRVPRFREIEHKPVRRTKRTPQRPIK